MPGEHSVTRVRCCSLFYQWMCR